MQFLELLLRPIINDSNPTNARLGDHRFEWFNYGFVLVEARHNYV
jgi:hypothetical protein